MRNSALLPVRAGIGYTDSVEDNKPLPNRQVLSFVRRSGHFDNRLKRAWSRYAPQYLLDINTDADSLDLRPDFRFNQDFIARTWGRRARLIVEVGSGQGENIVAAAQANPDVDFLAVEVYGPGVAHTMLMAGKSELTNLRVAQANAPELFEVSAPAVASEVWTFFPDPWPKMRHHKRRIIQPSFADAVHTVLPKGGVWRIATDIEDYALHIHEVMDGRTDFRNAGNVTVSLPTEHVGKGTADQALALPHADFTQSARFDGRVVTNFERKGMDAGRVIHDFEYLAV
jgi:tRNA (guanine-N7-)-methyltransferase